MKKYDRLRFTRLRVPDTETALSEVERRQLDLLQLGYGYELGEGDRLGPGALFERAFELWDVVGPDGVCLGTAFCTGMDLVLFAAGSTDILGSAIQHRYEGFDEQLTAALKSAERPANQGLVLPTIDFPVSGVVDEPLPLTAAEVDWSGLVVADPFALVGLRRRPMRSARGVPSQVRRLAYGTDPESGQAAHLLRYALVGEDVRDVSAAAPAVELLLESVSGARFPARIIALVTHIVRAEASTPGIRRPCRQAAADFEEVLEGLSLSDSGDVRGAALELLETLAKPQ